MGNLCSTDPVAKSEAKQNKDIEKLLRDAKKGMLREIKLLLLGAGESGKSTIAKQMKIIHLQGYNDKERQAFKAVIYSNVYNCIKAVLQGAATLKIELSQETKDLAAQVLADGYFTGIVTKQLAEDIAKLWKDEAVQAAFARGSEYQLFDSAQYYMENAERISKEDYVPSEQDILRTRVKTTGILEIEFEVNKIKFRMVDVGGQRSERKKWIHCFQDVIAVIFCVALSEYDLRLSEDSDTNRMHESLRIFKEVCNTQWFEKTDIILFLNKSDIFTDKIQKTPLTVAFPEYKGQQAFQPASEYIQQKFIAQCEVGSTDKKIYPHITCATDTTNITHVFEAVKDIVLHRALTSAGF